MYYTDYFSLFKLGLVDNCDVIFDNYDMP
jgi:hypothetical protein